MFSHSLSSRKLSAALAAAALAVATTSAPAAITIDVTPTLAPNIFGSPNWNAWQTNALAAIEAGSTTFGSGVAQFDALPNNSTLDWRQAVVTGFDSWKGVADPNTPAYSGEYGNRMHFALHILGNGEKFAIGDLAFVGSSSDPFDTLAFSYGPGNPNGEYNYSAGYVGIDYGPNLVKGGGDDVYITSGPSTQLVDEVVGRGSGNSLDTYLTDPGSTLQERIDNSAALFGIYEDFSFTGTYTLGSTTASATVNYTVPEPSTIGLAGVAAIGMLSRRRRA